MNTFRRIESLYRENGYKTHYAEKKHNRILLLYPNIKKSKIYGVHMDSDYGLVNVGCADARIKLLEKVIDDIANAPAVSVLEDEAN